MIFKYNWEKYNSKYLRAIIKLKKDLPFFLYNLKSDLLKYKFNIYFFNKKLPPKILSQVLFHLFVNSNEFGKTVSYAYYKNKKLVYPLPSNWLNIIKKKIKLSSLQSNLYFFITVFLQLIKDYLKKHSMNSLIIGVSGGIDSAVTSTLCALTGYKTQAVIMPIHQNINETKRGVNHCNFLIEKYNNVEMIKVDLTSVYDELVKTIPEKFCNNLTLANVRARIRMSTLYMVAGGSNGIVVGTGNKVEDFGVGFFTKYGDGGVDISPIGDLMKSEVYTLAKSLEINKEIIEAPPTDGLWDDGRTDEDQLGVSYDELEWAMNNENKDLNNKELDII